MVVRNNFAKVVTFLVLLFCVNWGVGTMMEFLYNRALENGARSNEMMPSHSCQIVDSPVLIIGSSRANHHYNTPLMSDLLDCDVYNCGRNGSFFLYQTCVIDGIINRYKPQVIIWNIDLLPIDLERKYRGIKDFYPMYSLNSYTDSVINSRGKFQKIMMQSTAYRHNDRFLSYMKGCVVSDNDNNLGYSPLPNEGYKYPILITKSAESEMNESDINFDIFNESLRKCKEKGVDVVVVMSPVFIEYIDYRNSSSYKTLCEIVDENGMRFIDFYQDEQFLRDSTLFKDAMHLNSQGATKFTQGLCEELKKYNN